MQGPPGNDFLTYVSRPNSSVCGRFRRAARCVSTRAKPRSSGRDFGQGRVALRHLSVVAAAQGCMTMMKVSTVLPCAPHRLAASEHGMVSRHRQRVDVIAWSLPARVSTVHVRHASRTNQLDRATASLSSPLSGVRRGVSYCCC